MRLIMINVCAREIGQRGFTGTTGPKRVPAHAVGVPRSRKLRTGWGWTRDTRQTSPGGMLGCTHSSVLCPGCSEAPSWTGCCRCGERSPCLLPCWVLCPIPSHRGAPHLMAPCPTQSPHTLSMVGQGSRPSGGLGQGCGVCGVRVLPIEVLRLRSRWCDIFIPLSLCFQNSAGAPS